MPSEKTNLWIIPAKSTKTAACQGSPLNGNGIRNETGGYEEVQELFGLQLSPSQGPGPMATSHHSLILLGPRLRSPLTCRATGSYGRDVQAQLCGRRAGENWAKPKGRLHFAGSSQALPLAPEGQSRCPALWGGSNSSPETEAKTILVCNPLL